MFVNADLLSPPGPFLFYHHCIPRLIGYQNIAFLGAKRHQFGNGRVVYANMYVHSGLR